MWKEKRRRAVGGWAGGRVIEKRERDRGSIEGDFEAKAARPGVGFMVFDFAMF